MKHSLIPVQYLTTINYNLYISWVLAVELDFFLRPFSKQSKQTSSSKSLLYTVLGQLDVLRESSDNELGGGLKHHLVGHLDDRVGENERNGGTQSDRVLGERPHPVVADV